MNRRWFSLLTVLIVTALVIGAMTLGVMLAQPATLRAAQPLENTRQITVLGTGEVTVTPDQATLQVGVQSEAGSARDALADNSAKMSALLDQLKTFGIAEKDIQTSGFNLSQTYDKDGQPSANYQVGNTVAVVIHDVAHAGDLVDSVVGAGANTIYGFTFSVADPKPLEKQARDAAITDARSRAEALAVGAGGSLGQIVAINESINGYQPMYDGGGAGMGGGNTPIQAGEQTITAQIQVTYLLR